MDVEKLWQIPKNWKWTQIKALGDVIGGGTPSTKELSYWGKDINWISPSDLTDHSSKTISHGAKGLSKLGLENSSAKVMPAGSIHFSSRAPIGYVAISAERLATNQGFKSLIPTDGIFSEYVYYYLKGSKHLAEKSASGTTFSELSGKAFGLLPIPLPPTKEQLRIVAKIEELFSELDKGIESLKTAREQLKVYRQTVLKHAFEGKLTDQWREENKHKLETPEQLRTRIKKECEKRYQEQLEQWNIAVKTWEGEGKKGKKPSRPRQLDYSETISLDESNSLPELPRGWVYTRLGNLIDEPKYGTSKKCDYDINGVGVLRIPNIAHGVIDASDLKFAYFDEEEVKTYNLKEGDILTIRSNGSISLVGKCALISEPEECFVFAGYLIRLRPNKVLILPQFLISILSSHFLRTQIEQKAKSTSGVNNINSSEIKDLIVPLCSIEEQDKLMQYLASILSSSDVVDTEINMQIVRSESLRQSILKQAFSGKLVEQDPNDEPASMLLERIKAEKTEQEKTHGKNSRSKTGEVIV